MASVDVKMSANFISWALLFVLAFLNFEHFHFHACNLSIHCRREAGSCDSASHVRSMNRVFDIASTDWFDVGELHRHPALFDPTRNIVKDVVKGQCNMSGRVSQISNIGSSQISQSRHIFIKHIFESTIALVVVIRLGSLIIAEQIL